MKARGRRLSTLMLVPTVALSFGLTACGTQVVDTGKAEQLLRNFITQNGGTAKSVKCPSTNWKQGGTFDCRVTVAGSSGATQSGTITVHMLKFPNVTATAADVHVQ
jgi:Domain of unknown function (DUF4333)